MSISDRMPMNVREASSEVLRTGGPTVGFRTVAAMRRARGGAIDHKPISIARGLRCTNRPKRRMATCHQKWHRSASPPPALTRDAELLQSGCGADCLDCNRAGQIAAVCGAEPPRFAIEKRHN